VHREFDERATGDEKLTSTVFLAMLCSHFGRGRTLNSTWLGGSRDRDRYQMIILWLRIGTANGLT